MMKKIILIFILFFLLLPSLVLADITISNPKLSKGIAYEGDEVVFSVDVASGNATTKVSAELIKTNSTNTTTSSIGLSLVGSSTRGSWIKFFNEKQGVYEITKVIVVDNTSLNQTFLMRDYGFIGFKVLERVTTTTTYATNTTTTSSVTTSSTTASSITTSSTTVVQPPTGKNLGQSILENPLMLIMIVIVVVVVPIFLFLLIPK